MQVHSTTRTPKMATYEEGPHVYFIQVGDDGPIKIGVANVPEERRKQIQTGHYEDLRIRLIFPCSGRDMEAHLHRIFANYRLRGEWFAYSGELYDFLNKTSKSSVVDAAEEPSNTHKALRDEISCLRILWWPRLHTEGWLPSDAALALLLYKYPFKIAEPVIAAIHSRESVTRHNWLDLTLSACEMVSPGSDELPTNYRTAVCVLDELGVA